MISVLKGEEMICPICGVAIVGPADVCGPPFCDHVRFIYLNGEIFGFAEPGLEELIGTEQELADEADLHFDAWEALAKYIEPDGQILERIDENMACGSIRFKIWAGLSASKSPPSID